MLSIARNIYTIIVKTNLRFNLISDAALLEQIARVGEQSAIQQAGTALATHEAALRFLFHDGVRTSHRVHTQNTHIQARLRPSQASLYVCKYTILTKLILMPQVSTTDHIRR